MHLYIYKIINMILLNFILILSFHCDSKNNQKKIIDNKRNLSKIAHLEKIGEIVLDESNENLISELRVLKVSEQGNFYLSDYGVGSIHVFSPSGKSLRTISRKGDAPNEFNSLWYFDLKSDSIIAWDMTSEKYVIFDTLGIFQKYFRLKDVFAYDLCFGSDCQNLYQIISSRNDFSYQVNNISNFRIVNFSIEQEVVINQSEKYNTIMKNTIDLTKYFCWMARIKREHKFGKIYWCMEGIPYIVENDNDLTVMRKINVTTPITNLFLYKDGIYTTKPSSIISDFCLLEEKNILLVLQLRLDYKGDISKQQRTFYLCAFDLNSEKPELIMPEKRVPSHSELQPYSVLIAIGPDEIIYLLEDDRPDHNVIGKYRLQLKNEF